MATVVIKRLKDALAAGDPIRAVIRGSSLNQDGKTETITTPSLEAQEALIRACYRNAGLNPQDTQYFEAHGTGTVRISTELLFLIWTDLEVMAARLLMTLPSISQEFRQIETVPNAPKLGGGL